MPELIAKSALGGLPPLTLIGTTLAEVDPGTLTAIAPFPGREKKVAAALKPLGVSFPAPNTESAKGDVRLIWTGREQAFLIGADAPAALADHAALTDQSDGWACLSLTGPAAVEALSRLIPLDLREAAFPVGRVTRAPLGHMSMILSRRAADSFQIMVFRSMARTAWHEIGDAIERIAARATLS